jgi:phage shock protein PspC (stress-responsive transcriptional regulator)
MKKRKQKFKLIHKKVDHINIAWGHNRKGATKIMTALSTITADRWVRSDDGLIAGVCEGLGRSFGISPWVLRALWLGSVLALGTGLLLYAIFAFCLPRIDRLPDAQRRRILGVCARISRASGWDVGAVRTLAVLSALASFGATLLVYIVLFFVMPDESDALVY